MLKVGGTLSAGCDECGLEIATARGHRILNMYERMGQHVRSHIRRYGWFEIESHLWVDLIWQRPRTFRNITGVDYQPGRKQQPPLQWGIRALVKISNLNNLEEVHVKDARRGVLA